MARKLTGQYKIDPFTGKSYVVASKATEAPNLEEQASLLDWAEDQEKLSRWMEAQHRSVDCEAAMNTLFTIGYGGRTLSQMAQTLLGHGVKLLIDVRASPRTRLPGFNKGQLARTLLANDILYSHISELGNANYKQADASIRLVNEAVGLELLRSALEVQPAAIMCACRKHEGCHRHYISQRLVELVQGVTIHHIA